MTIRDRTRSVLIGGACTTLIAFAVSECQAGRWFSPARRHSVRRQVTYAERPVLPATHQDGWRRRNDDPRYYGGFHVRYFDSLGVPSGDIGLRGNGIYFYP